MVLIHNQCDYFVDADFHDDTHGVCKNYEKIDIHNDWKYSYSMFNYL